MNRGKARKLREVIEQASASLPDETALEGVELFPIWEPGRACVSGERLHYHGELYLVLQDHTAQADWTPDAAHSLFVRVSEPGTITEWVQPLGRRTPTERATRCGTLKKSGRRTSMQTSGSLAFTDGRDNEKESDE